MYLCRCVSIYAICNSKNSSSYVNVSISSYLSFILTHPLAATRSAPTTTQSTPFTAIKAEAIESAINVPGRPSWIISKAVRRAPW